jgi:hypothetical protein
MYLSLSLGHRIATPPLPLGTWKFEIGSLEGIKLIQQEQKKYFLTIPSLLKVPPNLHSLQMETEVSRI